MNPNSDTDKPPTNANSPPPNEATENSLDVGIERIDHLIRKSKELSPLSLLRQKRLSSQKRLHSLLLFLQL